MSNENDLQPLQELFNQAIERPECERAEFLENACGDNREMLEELQSLVTLHFGAAAHFLEESPVLTTPQSYSGQEVGQYKILSLIGYGGMADVYLAHRTDGVFKNDVALKLVRGSNHSEDFIARLRNERLILSNLKHPNIANLLDGGSTEDGTPYYVMDYIDGVNLLDYSKQHNLSIRQKLKLFLKICAGVTAAHRNLILHRDLKPSNIIVTAEGEPKLLDFGVAKDMTASTRTTSLLPMTARYASPEQLRGEILSTASDIYSLGVILYELLTDCSPYETESPLELIQQITESTPELMSHKLQALDKSVSRALSGDLDTIVMKTLHKEPGRRYVSVQRLADDIESYLSNRPVKARSDSYWYRGNRFVRRNWAMVAVVVIALVTVVTAVWIQQVRVIEERDSTAMERDKLRQTKEFLVGLFKIADPGEARGNSITARELLDRGLKQIDQGLGGQPEFKSELMLTMGVVYRELGLYDTSSTLLEDTLLLRKKYFPTDSVELADSMDQLGTLMLLRGQHESALALHNEALAIYQEKYGDSHPQLVSSYFNIGYDFYSRGEYEQAEKYYDKSLTIGLETLGDTHESIARTYIHLGTIRGQRGEYDQSIEYREKGLAIYSKTLGDDHPDVAYAYAGLARAYRGKGDIDRAIEFMEKSLAIYKETLGEEHPKVARTGYGNIAILYATKGEYDKAISYFNKSLLLLQKSLGNNHPRLAPGYTNLGFVFMKKGDYKQAIENTQKAVSLLIKAFGENHPNLAHAYDNLGGIYQAKGDRDRALYYYNKAYTIWLKTLGPEHSDTLRMEAAIAGLAAGK